MKNSSSKIVADGPKRFRHARGYRAVKQALFTEISRRYAAEMQKASLWRRVWLHIRIRREVAAELRKEFSSTSLHILAALK